MSLFRRQSRPSAPKEVGPSDAKRGALLAERDRKLAVIAEDGEIRQRIKGQSKALAEAYETALRERKRASRAAPLRQRMLIEVQFVALHEEPRPRRRGFVCVWPFRWAPLVGDRVFLPNPIQRVEPAAVTSTRARVPSGYTRSHMHTISWVASTKEMLQAFTTQLQADAARDVWLDMARRVVGLPVDGASRTKPPKPFPPIPPFDGDAPAQEANIYAQRWLDLYTTARGAGRPEDEIKAFRSRAYRWYAVRDRNTTGTP